MSIETTIINVAKSYLGQEEISGNKGFKNRAFQAKIQACGWKLSEAWCAYFAELVWKEAYGRTSSYWSTLDRLFSPSATATYANFKGHQLSFKVGSKPTPGALVVWRNGRGWKGHIGIVSRLIDATTFKSIEGNTSRDGEDEEILVFEKTRKLNKPFSETGPNLIGFVYPPENM